MRFISAGLVAILLTTSSLTPARAQTPLVRLLETKTVDRVRAMESAAGSVIGFTAIDLTNNDTFGWHSDAVFAQASSIKIPILIELLRAAENREIEMDRPLRLEPAEAVGGSGHLRLLLRNGLQLTPLELGTAMIQTSDNTATNKLINLLGMDKINRTVEGLGLRQTKLQRIMLDSAAASSDRENISTPQEMAELARLLYTGKAVSDSVSKRALEIMKLPEGSMRAAVPPEIEVAAKPGSVRGVRCETGVIFLPNRPFALSVMSAFLDDGQNPIPAITTIVLEHFTRIASSNRFGNRVR